MAPPEIHYHVNVSTAEIRATSVVSPWWALTLLPLLAGLFGPRSFAAGVFLVIPAVVLAAAIGEKRSRKSVLQTEQLPILIGQRFSGQIVAELDPVPEQEFWLVLRCTEPDLGSDSNARLTLWQDELTVYAADVAWSARRARVPFSFEMPTTGKASDDAVEWELHVSARGYAAKFELPVKSGGVPPAVSDERTRMFSIVRNSLRRSL
jgi:hypothetical protein